MIWHGLLKWWVMPLYNWLWGNRAQARFEANVTATWIERAKTQQQREAEDEAVMAEYYRAHAAWLRECADLAIQQRDYEAQWGDYRASKGQLP